MVLCGKCGRTLKDPESIQRGFGPVCYRKVMPPTPKKEKIVRKSNDNYNIMEDPDYQIPGQMELSDFIEMNAGGDYID